MTTLHQIQAALQGAVSAALAGLQFNSAPLNVDVGIGWPPLTRLQSVARGEPCVAIYDRRIVRNSTRWNPYSYNETTTPATLTTIVSRPIINPSGSATITLGGSVTVNDAVSALILNRGTMPFSTSPAGFQAFPPAAQVVVGIAGDTPATMATKLAAAVTGDATLSTWVTAVAAGPVVTIAAKSGIGPLTLASYTGNQGTQTRELGRREREFQIVLWAQTDPMRNAIGDPLDEMIANAELNFGIAVPDGVLRIAYVGDYDVEDATLQDAYRRDFHVSAEYGITTQDILYAVLAPELAQYAEAP